jgi:hypothetical protein
LDDYGVYQAVPTHWLFQFAAVSNYQGQNEDMRTLAETIVAIAVLGCWSCFGAGNIIAQTHPSTSELVKRFQSPKTTDDARRQLLQVGNSDPDDRRYLAVHLPPMIEIGPKSCPPSDIEDLNTRWHACPWYNAVELSGKLRIAEAVTALAPWIGWRVDGPLLPILEAQLVFHPAAKALAEIGDPAIPVLQQVLSSGKPGEHAVAVRVLCIIHTPKAKAVLREDLPHETDPAVQTMIKNCLR